MQISYINASMVRLVPTNVAEIFDRGFRIAALALMTNFVGSTSLFSINSNAQSSQMDRPVQNAVSSITPLVAPLRYDVGCKNPANLIVVENCLQGTTDWIITKFSDELNGFAEPSTVNLGETVKFFVSTNASIFSLTIYRSGYYQGTGGRLIRPVQTITGHAQPDCYRDLQTGLASCSNWAVSTSLAIPSDWVSGIYIAKFSDNHGDNFAIFTVRDDARKSDILYQQSMFTSQAYNKFAGKSSYDNNAMDMCPTGMGLPRSVQISFNRPLFTGDMTEGDSENDYFVAEYGMVRWLEAQGYDVTYSNTLDTHRSGEPGAHNKLLDHRVFLSSGHDEYWSQPMRDAVTAARDAGVNIGFFSGNTAYWRVRLEADPLTGEPDGIMTLYKTIQDGPHDPNGPTSTWRDRLTVNNPENELLGTQYIGDNDLQDFPMQIASAQAHDRIYRHTGLAALPADTSAVTTQNVIGWEWDAIVDNGHTPTGLAVLASSPVFGFMLHDDGNYLNGDIGSATANMSRYIAPTGGIVFSSGTIDWSWGLGTRGITATAVDPIIQQITYNVLADMKVLSATPSSDIILDNSNRPDPDLSHIHVVPSVGLGPIISDLRADPNAIYGMVQITWHTNVPTNGQAWLGHTSDHTITPTQTLINFTLDHMIVVSTADDFNKVMYYRVASVDQNNLSTISDARSFGTGLPSIRTSLHQTLNTTVESTKCWFQANPSARPLVIGALITALIAVLTAFAALVVRVIPCIVQNRRSAQA